MQPPSQPDPDYQLLLEAHARWADMPPVRIDFARADLHAIVVFLQLAARHNDLSDWQHTELVEIGRRLQAIVCDTPELLAFTDMGWEPRHDLPAPPQPDESEDDGSAGPTR